MNLRHDPVIHDLNKHLAEIDEAEQYDLQAEAVMKRAEEIAVEMITPEGYNDNGVIYNIEDAIEHAFQDLDQASEFALLLSESLQDGSSDGQRRLKQFITKHAIAEAKDIAWREAG